MGVQSASFFFFFKKTLKYRFFMGETPSLKIQMGSYLQWFTVFFDFTVVQKQNAFGRNHTLNLDLFPRLVVVV